MYRPDRVAPMLPIEDGALPDAAYLSDRSSDQGKPVIVHDRLGWNWPRALIEWPIGHRGTARHRIAHQQRMEPVPRRIDILVEK